MKISDMLRKYKTTNKYFNASLVYIIASGIGQGTTLLANIFFTRYMSRADYGLYSNYYSYVSILIPFVGMNLFYGLTNAYLDYKKEIHEFRSSVLMLSIIGFALTSILISIVNLTIGLTIPVICIALALFHSYGFFLINYYIRSMNMENRIINKGVMLAIPYVFQAVFAIVAVILNNTYISRAVGATVGIMICGLFGFAIIIKEARPVIKIEYWKYVLRISLPAIISSVSGLIMMQCDKLMITSMIGAEKTAVYALVYNIGYILYAVFQATSGVWQAWLFNTLDSCRYENIKTVQKWYLFLMLVLATILYMLAPEMIKVLSPKDYWKFEYVPPFIVGSYLIVMYSMNMSVIQFEKKTEITASIITIAAILNVTLNYILIPKYGGVGAAYASVISYFVIFLAGRFYLNHKGILYLADSIYFSNSLMVVLLGVIFNILMNRILIRYFIFFMVLLGESIYVLVKRREFNKLLGVLSY